VYIKIHKPIDNPPPNKLPNYFSNNPVPLWGKVAISALSFFSYIVTFLVTEMLPDQLLYDDWIYLIFLPAGSKLVFILLFGIWGTLGDVLALMIMSAMFVFEEDSAWLWFLYAVVSGAATYMGVCLSKHYLGVGSTLKELRYEHIPILALIGSITHGFITITTLMLIGQVPTNEFFANSFAMIMGDFFGIFIFIFIGRIIFNAYWRIIDSKVI
jgi:hypothetical protein